MGPIPPDMLDGTWLANALREAGRDYTAALLVGTLVALAVQRRAILAGVDARIRGTLVLVAGHLLTLPALGALAAHGSERAYANLRLVSFAFAVPAAINVALMLVFAGLLRWLRLTPPRILLDVLAGGAYVVAAFVLLSQTGVHLSGLIATSAVLTAVIGFSLQDTLGNLIGGLTMQMENAIRPGDWIKFKDYVGLVREVRWRHTAIETRNWETVIIPHSVLSKSEVVVLGRRAGEPLQWRRWIHFDVDYRHAPTQVIETCVAALTKAAIPGVARTPAPQCVLMDLRGSYCRYAARYWLTDLAHDDGIDSVVRTRLFFALRRADVPLAMDAHAVFVTEDTESRRERRAKHGLKERKAALREVELFENLDDEEIAELTRGLRFTPFAAGETMAVQGAEGHDLYLILHGEVSVQVAAGADTKEVAVVRDGAVFGERSLMTGEPRSATAVAITDVVSYRLAKDEFERVLRRRPELADHFAEILAQREASVHAARDDLEARASRARVAADSKQILAKIRSFFGL